MLSTIIVERHRTTEQLNLLLESLKAYPVGHIVSVPNKTAAGNLREALAAEGHASCNLSEDLSPKARALRIHEFKTNGWRALITDECQDDLPNAAHIFIFNADEILPPESTPQASEGALLLLYARATERIVLCYENITREIQKIFG